MDTCVSVDALHEELPVFGVQVGGGLQPAGVDAAEVGVHAFSGEADAANE